MGQHQCDRLQDCEGGRLAGSGPFRADVAGRDWLSLKMSFNGNGTLDAFRFAGRLQRPVRGDRFRACVRYRSTRYPISPLSDPQMWTVTPRACIMATLAASARLAVATSGA